MQALWLAGFGLAAGLVLAAVAHLFLGGSRWELLIWIAGALYYGWGGWLVRETFLGCSFDLKGGGLEFRRGKKLHSTGFDGVEYLHRVTDDRAHGRIRGGVEFTLAAPDRILSEIETEVRRVGGRVSREGDPV